MPAHAEAVFTIGNYPVEATASNAVAAKERALTDGQQAAFRSLLKRLVPVTAYRRIAGLQSVKAGDLVAGVAVRSERNSSTQYIANMDFSFQPGAVRDLLRRQGVPFIDEQAPPITIIPIYQGAGGAARAASSVWLDAWRNLDRENSLTPFRVETLRDISPDTIKSVVAGDAAALRSLAQAYGTTLVLLAIAEPEPAAQKLHVMLAGRDAVGAFTLKRTYRMPSDDPSYASELASVVALGTLEGRWKAIKAGSAPGGIEALSAHAEPVQITVEYRSLQQWQEIRRALAETPGVEDFQVGGLGARLAEVALRFPGGGSQLAATVARRGLEMRGSGASWVLRSSY